MYIEKKSPHANGREDSSWSNRNFTIPHECKNCNTYLLSYEKKHLAFMLKNGATIKFRSPFTDTRHKIIYAALLCFLDNFPPQQYSATWFLSYLKETDMINQCGGEAYVRSIFHGIGDL